MPHRKSAGSTATHMRVCAVTAIMRRHPRMSGLTPSDLLRLPSTRFAFELHGHSPSPQRSSKFPPLVESPPQTSCSDSVPALPCRQQQAASACCNPASTLAPQAMSRTAAPVPRPPTIAFPESAPGQFDFAATSRTSTLLPRFLLQSYRWVYLSSACSSFSKNMLTLSGLTMRIHAGLPKDTDKGQPSGPEPYSGATAPRFKIGANGQWHGAGDELFPNK